MDVSTVLQDVKKGVSGSVVVGATNFYKSIGDYIIINFVV